MQLYNFFLMKQSHLRLFPFVLLLLSSVSIWVGCRNSTTFDADGKAANDSLSLRIACLPTMDCLPFYYAVESGLCDSLELPLYIRTFQSQFDADTALMGNVFDGGVTDVHRYRHHREKGLLQPCVALIPTDGRWQLVVNGVLRLKKTEQLKGRTLAAARHSVSDRISSHLKDSLRLGSDDIYQPQINSYRLRYQMLDNAQVDAAVLPEPWGTLAAVSGHRVLSSFSSRKYSVAFYVKKSSLSHARKARQVARLKEVYNLSVKALNTAPSSALDSVLIKTYRLPENVVDTLRLPYFQPVK